MSDRFKRPRREEITTQADEATANRNTEERRKPCHVAEISIGTARPDPAFNSHIAARISPIRTDSSSTLSPSSTAHGVSTVKTSIAPSLPASSVTGTSTAPNNNNTSTISASSNNNNNHHKNNNNRINSYNSTTMATNNNSNPPPSPERGGRTLDNELDDLDLDEDFKESIRAMTPSTRREVLNDIIRERRLSVVSSLLPQSTLGGGGATERTAGGLGSLGIMLSGIHGGYTMSFSPQPMYQLVQSDEDVPDTGVDGITGGANDNNNNIDTGDNNLSNDGTSTTAATRTARTHSGNRRTHENRRTNAHANSQRRFSTRCAEVEEHDVLDNNNDDDNDDNEEEQEHTPVAQRMSSGRGLRRRRVGGGSSAHPRGDSATDESAAVRTERQFVHDLEALTSLMFTLRNGMPPFLHDLGNNSNNADSDTLFGIPNNSRENSNAAGPTIVHENNEEEDDRSVELTVGNEVSSNNNNESNEEEEEQERGHQDAGEADGSDQQRRNATTTAAGNRWMRHGSRGRGNRGGGARRERHSAQSPPHTPFTSAVNSRFARGMSNPYAHRTTGATISSNRSTNNNTNNVNFARDRRSGLAMLAMQEAINREFTNLVSRLQERSVFQSMGITRDIDDMTYEELLELEERIGNVSKGLTPVEARAVVEVLMSDPEEGCCSICQEEWASAENTEAQHSQLAQTGQGESGMNTNNSTHHSNNTNSATVQVDGSLRVATSDGRGSETDAAAAVTSPVLKRRCVKINVCGHNFHDSCIDEWFKNNKTCPVCTRDVLEK